MNFLELLPLKTVLLTTCFVASFAHSATLTVGKGGAFDYSTISAGVAGSATGDTILVGSGIYDATDGEIFPIEIDKEISIIGSSSAETVVDATGSGTVVFQIVEAAGFQIANLVIKGGNGMGAGGVHAIDSSGVIESCRFERNVGIPAGAIYLEKSVCDISRCHFSNNQAVQALGSDNLQAGAGVLATGSAIGEINITGSVFTANSSGGRAGVIGFFSFTPIRIDGCEFTENRPSSYHGEFALVYLGNLTQETVMSNCMIQDNSGIPDQLISSAIRCYDFRKLRLIGNDISRNHFMDGARLQNAIISNCYIAENDGNGIYAVDLELENSIVDSNKGTGILISQNSVFLGIKNSTISNNGLSPDANQTAAAGIDCQFAARVDIVNSTISGNTSRFNATGGIYVKTPRFQMTNTVVVGNQSLPDGLGVGGLLLDGGTNSIENKMANCTFQGNQGAVSELKFLGIASATIGNTIVWGAT
ncbi:MAG: right-handed parallel beta-helix repeat-containing protein, partial [Candidatus Omnitrophica bacterium]|nr:right-handed parallel beta-helix repeat-containing protein [Candidatus Omnitrophota bacterium]